MQAGAQANFDRAGLELAAGRIDQASSAAQAACDVADRLLARDRSVAMWRTTLQLRCLRTRARIALRSGRPEEAVTLARQTVVLARSEQGQVDRAIAVADGELLLGEALRAAGQADAARGAFERALSSWPGKIEERPYELANHTILLKRLGKTGEANVIGRRLSTMGYRQPDYLNGRSQG